MKTSKIYQRYRYPNYY